MTLSCNVCKSPLTSLLYESAENVSVTTMNKLIDGKTHVYFCDACGHLQTNELPNLVEYYAHEYEINLTSEDDDQLYRVVDGNPVFRADHQANVLLSKVDFFPGCRVLDYGCAKALTLKKVLGVHPDIRPFLFDVTDKYIPFWKSFPALPEWSVHEPNPAWHGSIDVALSFYALEHVADLHAALANVKALLKPGGIFYFIVPNVYSNIADFIVADHINHFSKNSLLTLLTRAGFHDVSVDDQVHDAAFVVKATLGPAAAAKPVNEGELAEERAAALQMAQYWSTIVRRICEFEKQASAAGAIAIYGAGFYGNLIASSLNTLDHVRCFIDQNCFLQGKQLCGRPVLSPRDLPKEVTHVLVGMNPRSARSGIDAIVEWRERRLTYFFL